MQADAAKNLARASLQAHIANIEDARHGVGILHRSSRRLARYPSGNDITRYNNAHRIPGMTQLPMLVAKICVCLVSSTTVSIETSDESLSSATKSLVIGASAMRKACGARIKRSV